MPFLLPSFPSPGLLHSALAQEMSFGLGATHTYCQAGSVHLRETPSWELFIHSTTFIECVYSGNRIVNETDLVLALMEFII